MSRQKQTKHLLKLLTQNALTLALAESCTGGGIANAITDIPGASRVLVGGVVAYTAEAKRVLLGLDLFELPPGCVGSELTLKMAANIKGMLKADIGLGITGALGPESPWAGIQVGEVYISVVGLGQETVTEFNISGDRQTIKSTAINAGIDCLLQFIAG